MHLEKDPAGLNREGQRENCEPCRPVPAWRQPPNGETGQHAAGHGDAEAVTTRNAETSFDAGHNRARRPGPTDELLEPIVDGPVAANVTTQLTASR